MTANRPLALTAGRTANKDVIMEEKRCDLNRQAGRAGGDYDEDCR